MKRRILIALILALMGGQALTAMPARAATFVDQVVSQLRAQGFDEIEVERTLLGRARIAASRQDGSREIVLNPQTGEILRDLWTSIAGDTTGQITIGDDRNSGSDIDDDDNDDGNSGPGGSDDSDGSDDDGGNEGSGGGGSGSGSGSGSDNSGSGGED